MKEDSAEEIHRETVKLLSCEPGAICKISWTDSFIETGYRGSIEDILKSFKPLEIETTGFFIGLADGHFLLANEKCEMENKQQTFRKITVIPLGWVQSVRKVI